MCKIVNELNAMMAEYETEPDCAALDIRLDMATIVMDRITALRWSVERLADAVPMSAGNVNLLLDGHLNFTTKTAGDILHALGVRATLTAGR